MTEESQARMLAEWLDGRRHLAPPDELDPEVREALAVIRPDRMPAPRLTADDILAEVRTGPLASSRGGGSAHGEITAQEIDNLVPANTSWRRWFGGGMVGILAAAVALILVLPPRSEGPAPTGSAGPAAPTSPAVEGSVTEPMIGAAPAAPSPGSALTKRSGAQVVENGAPRPAEAAGPSGAPGARGIIAEAMPPSASIAQGPARQELKAPAEAPAGAGAGAGEARAADDGAVVAGEEGEPTVVDGLAAAAADRRQDAAEKQEAKSYRTPASGTREAAADAAPSAPSADEVAAPPMEFDKPAPVAVTPWFDGLGPQERGAFEQALDHASGLAAGGDPAGAARSLSGVIRAPVRAGQNAALQAARYAIAAGETTLALQLVDQGVHLSDLSTPERAWLLSLRAILNTTPYGPGPSAEPAR